MGIARRLELHLHLARFRISDELLFEQLLGFVGPEATVAVEIGGG